MITDRMSLSTAVAVAATASSFHRRRHWRSALPLGVVPPEFFQSLSVTVQGRMSVMGVLLQRRLNEGARVVSHAAATTTVATNQIVVAGCGGRGHTARAGSFCSFSASTAIAF